MNQTFVTVFESTSPLKMLANSAAIDWLQVRYRGVAHFAHVARVGVAPAVR